MMDNQHRKITGYRDLNKDEVDMINNTKGLALMCEDLIEKLESMDGVDNRSIAIAKTNLQQGFMWAVRSVAQPTTF